MIGENRAPCGTDLLCIMGRDGTTIHHEAHCPRKAHVEGVWTPQAEVLCGVCHGPKFRAGQSTERVLPDAEFKRWCETAVDLDDRDSGATRCDRCKCPIVVERAVAAYARLRDALLARGGVDAKLEQTGGMCSALSVCRAGEKDPVVFVAGLDQGEQYSVGLYVNEEAVYDGSATELVECDNEEDAVKAVRSALAVGGA
ncbi:MAG: hypothetical protein EPN91_13125 [Salinibacterium sp.]|nr:MAG: hypothetical protein EPN91_13125 [Salinibacterium sp.]